MELGSPSVVCTECGRYLPLGMFSRMGQLHEAVCPHCGSHLRWTLPGDDPPAEPSIDLDRDDRPERPLEVVFQLAVVDDDRLTRRTVWASLSEEPALELVGEASSAESALALVRSAEPDVVVLDNQMRGPTTGTEVAPLLKHVRPELRIVMFSADADPGGEASAYVDAVVRKPNFELLLPTVRLLLRLPLTAADRETLRMRR